MPAAIYFDGKTARRWQVEVSVGPDGLELIGPDGPAAYWPLATLRELESLPGELKLRSLEAPELANLVIADQALIAAVRARQPALPHDAIRLETPRWKIVGLSLGAVASIFALILFFIPLIADRLALIVPISFERRLGESVAVEVKDMFKTEICTSPAGTSALQKLAGKLGEASLLRHPVRIDVLRTPVLNAIALPGGQVFLFDGLLQKARNVDEIAGVLGHEIGHEHNRDSLRSIFRSGGTAFLLGLLFGDVTGSWAVLFVSRQLFDSAHSREAETLADDHGRMVMHALGRSSADMARLLVRISGDEQGKGSIFASHPLSRERLQRLQGADAASGRTFDGPPLLSENEWRALRRICDND